jgi:F-type H+-transporting ATPase subunit epsilon
MNLEIVTPDRRVTVGETSDVVIPGVEGEFEVLPGHAAFLTALGTGILSFTPKNAHGPTRLMVSGGFVEVDRDQVTVMCESAALAAEISRDEASRQLTDAEQKLKQIGAVSVEDENFQMLRAEVDRAAAKLTLVK